MQQVYFAEQLEGIHDRWIQTSFGSVYSMTAGKVGQPLILIVHGSGPKNCSEQYRGLLQEYLVRVSYVEKFYMVAIDCPGYGRSKGSKEAVKTFPLRLFSEILHCLHYKSYFAMYGHSQGGAAIFNAVFENPSLSEMMVMDRPVCGSIQRFRQFGVPTLLVYDIEDEGHPLWQGKLLMKELKYAQFHTYRSSKSMDWAEDHMWDLMLSFFNTFQSKATKHLPRPIHSEEKFAIRNTSPPPKVSSSLSKQTHTRTLIPPLPLIQEANQYQSASVSSKSSNMSLSSATKKRLNYQKYLYEKEEVQEKSKQNLQLQDTKQRIKSIEKLQLQEKKEKLQNRCAICMETYYRPIQTNCHHIYCQKCLCESLLVKQVCPLCRQKITKKTERTDLQKQILEHMSPKQIQKRENAFQQLQTMLKSIIKIQIGNNSTQLQTKQSHFAKTKKKYQWQVYVKEPRNFPLEEVAVNINMGQVNAKPVRIRSAPFTFESRGTFSFTCEITIKPKSKEYAEKVAVYRINVEPGNHSNIISLSKKCYDK